MNNSMAKRTIIEKIERHAGELRDDECWVTDYAGDPQGYVYLRNGGKDYPQVRLHRVAYEAHYAEPIPEGLQVCHKCDNPACFNPSHLFLGTNQDNINDKVKKGRSKGISSERAYERAMERKRNHLGQWV